MTEERTPSYLVAVRSIVATATKHDGYNGATAKIGLAWWEGKAIAVADCGCWLISDCPSKDEVQSIALRYEALKSIDNGVDRDFVNSLLAKITA